MGKLYFDFDKQTIDKLFNRVLENKYSYSIIKINKKNMIGSTTKLIQHGTLVVNLINYYDEYLLPSYFLIEELENQANYSNDNSYLFYLDIFLNQLYSFEEYILQFFNDYFDLKLATSQENLKQIRKEIKYFKSNLTKLNQELLVCEEEQKYIIEAKIDAANVPPSSIKLLSISNFKIEYEREYVKDELYRLLVKEFANLNKLKKLRNITAHVRSFTFDGIKDDVNPYLPIYSISYSKKVNNQRIYKERGKIFSDNFSPYNIEDRNILNDLKSILDSCSKILDISNEYMVTSKFPNKLENEGQRYYLCWFRCEKCGSVFVISKYSNHSYSCLEQIPQRITCTCWRCIKKNEMILVRYLEYNEYYLKFESNKLLYKGQVELLNIYFDSPLSLRHQDKLSRLGIQINTILLINKKLDEFYLSHNYSFSSNFNKNNNEIIDKKLVHTEPSNGFIEFLFSHARKFFDTIMKKAFTK